jgi:hypothetical protein
MRTNRLPATLAALLAFAALPANAQIFRAYLALDGNDANPCTLQQPCRLLPAALAAVASGGEIWMLDSANYNTGLVSVDKGVTILAVPGVLGSVVASGANAMLINTTAAVTLRNLNILPLSGNTNRVGITKAGAGTLMLQDCNIFGFSALNGGAMSLSGATQTTITRSVIRDNRFGIVVTDGVALGISDTLFANNAQFAARASNNSATTRITVTRSVARNSLVAFQVDAVNVDAVARLDISETRIEGTRGATQYGVVVNGLAVAGAAASATVSSSVISGMHVGISASGIAKAFITGSTITDSDIAVQQLDLATVESAGNNAVRNNGTNVVGTLTPAAPL